uniref:Vesicle transport protein n=1 Tax=Polytomella parva TaxID=51329 RepID=A0A7S0V3Q4_9CHLO|mmetsp:Transcript_29558/g.54254  ORF Transcript_29558/g.54254 Transcript_29558/m.54254 type:complete len:251 (+) Transcript_29558:214-966(+)
MQMEWVKSNLLRNVDSKPATAAQNNPEESVTLLSAWQNYSTDRDVEVGSVNVVETGKTVIIQGVDRAQTLLTSFFQDGYTRVSATAQSSVQAIQSAEIFQIPSREQLVIFFSLLGAGAVFLTLAFVLFMPTLILMPSKFAVSFSLGCLCIMSSFIAIRGVKQQLAHMFSRERLPFSAAYISSILLTIYAASFLRSYILSIVFSAFQVIALLYYVMSYFPGGAQGALVLLKLVGRAASGCFRGFIAMVSKV